MLSIILNVLLFILVIGVLTFVHELGHFLVAKAIKAKVYEFALGFGPKLLKKKYKGTEYSIRMLPLGGFVKIMGDGDPGKYEEVKKDPGNLNNKPKVQQEAVMLAGVTMNILFCVVVYFIVIASMGWKIPLSNDFDGFNPVGGTISREIVGGVEYSEVIDGGNAQKANIPVKGEIKSIGEVELKYSDEIKDLLAKNKGESVNMNICEEDVCKNYLVEVSDEGTIGISMSSNYYVILSYENNKAFSGFAHVINTLFLISDRLGDMFKEAKQTGDYSDLSNSVSGPVGIYFLIDYFKQFGFITFVSIMADLSLSLAIINILPIPALDGGRVLILVIEGILRKDLNEKVESLIINTSFILLMILVLFIMIKDIVNIDNIKSMFS